MSDPAAMSRRSLLRRTGIVTATVAVAGTGALSYRVFDTAVLDPDGGDAFDPWRQWRRERGPLGTVAAAILAANPHNSQSWAFHVGDSTVDVFADRTRHTGVLDVSGREMHIGLGCAIENLTLAARAMGLVPQVDLLPDGAAGDRVASVAFAAGPPGPTARYEAIGDRHTNRGPYTSQPIDAGTLASLADADGLGDVAVHWIVDATDRAELGQLMIDAAEAVTADEEQSRDGFEWFRPDDDAIQRHRDGLTLDGQGMAPIMLTVAKLLPASSRSTGDEFWVRQTREVHTATAAAYGIMTVIDPYDVEAQLRGGRLLQRLHLEATVQGVAVHHMNQITERIDRERSTGRQPTFQPRLAVLLPTGRHALAAFRVGYADRTARRSPRRSLQDVTR